MLAAALAALLAPADAAIALDAAQVRDRVMRQLRAAGPYSGGYARVLGGEDIVAVRPDAPRIPASVEKLFITSSALLRWGPAEGLETRVVSDVPVEPDGTLPGDVWLVGGGDPTLSEAGLRRLAGDVRRGGVLRIEGGVRADDSRFDRRRGTPRTNFRPDGDLGGRLGALLLHRGFQPDPATYVATRFSRLLKAEGVRVGRRARIGTAPIRDDEATLAALGSPPMASLIRLTNVPSDNFLAEMLLKNLGASFGTRGTTGEGARVVRTTLDDFGIRPRIVDGSGLSRGNRTTPRQIVRLFERMDNQEIAASWRRSLAVAGRSGTVRRRMRRSAAAGRCHVKTGTIIGVSNLVGFCDTLGGRVGFAWLMNGVNPYSARPLQDRMTAAVARYSG